MKACIFTHDGRSQSIAAWAREAGVNVFTMRSRIVLVRKGRMELGRALTHATITPDKSLIGKRRYMGKPKGKRLSSSIDPRSFEEV